MREVVAERRCRCRFLCICGLFARLLLLFPAMTGHAALATGFTRFFTRPLVSRPFLVRGLAALARDLSLFVSIH
jgi:hypothetical protein